MTRKPKLEMGLLKDVVKDEVDRAVLNLRRDYLLAFARESNRIEGIMEVRRADFAALEELLRVPAYRMTVGALEQYVQAVQPGARLRTTRGDDVRVGDHVPMKGGPQIRQSLQQLLLGVNEGGFTPWDTHHWYEQLHPFMDGNGRSGRALWLWQVSPEKLHGRTFLHEWYYESLRQGR